MAWLLSVGGARIGPVLTGESSSPHGINLPPEGGFRRSLYAGAIALPHFRGNASPALELRG
jgi:hypothetical protein